MSTVLKTAIVVLPFLLAFLGIRACAGGASKRWRDRIGRFDPEAKIAVDNERVLVIAPDLEQGREIGAQVVEFREALARNYGELLGDNLERRIVVVLFSELEQLRARAGEAMQLMPGREKWLHGYTDSQEGAIYLPPGSQLDTLRHETVHLLMGQGHGGDVQHSTWLNEGLAQLFESYDPTARPPQPPGSVRAPPGRGDVEVRRLLEMDAREFYGSDVSRNYRDALLLITFLFRERDPALLQRYIDVERVRPGGREQAFAEIYRYHEEPFRTDFSNFVRRRG